jgi:acetyl-CoA acetyltransferase
MTKFEKPGSRDWDYPDMGREAIRNALADAGIGFESVGQVVAGYCYGDTTCGERAVYEVGLSGVPIFNVNNACATGSSALFIAKQFVQGVSRTARSRSDSRKWRKDHSARNLPIDGRRWTSTSN